MTYCCLALHSGEGPARFLLVQGFRGPSLGGGGDSTLSVEGWKEQFWNLSTLSLILQMKSAEAVSKPPAGQRRRVSEKLQIFTSEYPDAAARGSR